MEVNINGVYGIYEAIQGMRNPLSSWIKSDTIIPDTVTGIPDKITIMGIPVIGPNDLNLAKKLVRAGIEHRKFLRQIMVTMDINAPVFWWSEFDTYKIGTTRNSTSFMHTGTKRNLTKEDFEKGTDIECINIINKKLEEYRKNKSPELFEEIRANLPMGYLYLSTVTMNYENVLNMIHQREHHKLSQWRYFCERLKELPYIKDFLGEEE